MTMQHLPAHCFRCGSTRLYFSYGYKRRRPDIACYECGHGSVEWWAEHRRNDPPQHLKG